MPHNQTFGLPVWLTEALLQLNLQEPLWLVGGAVRDWLLQRESRDYDFVVVSGGRVRSRKLADILGAAYYALDQGRDTGRVVCRDDEHEWHLDIASLRGRDLDEDLISRDFTINALAVDVLGDRAIVDPTGGRQDLADGVLRACSSSSLKNDPVRLLRSVRIATELDLRIHPDLLHDIRSTLHLLREVSPERIRDEVFNILSLRHPVHAFLILMHTGLLHELSEILHEGFNPACLRDSDNASWDVFLRWMESFANLGTILRDPHPDQINADVGSALFFNSIKPFRSELVTYLDQSLSHGRTRESLMNFYLILICLYGTMDLKCLSDNCVKHHGWFEHCGKILKLSKAEIDFLLRLRLPEFSSASERDVALQAFRFFREVTTAGVASLLLASSRMRLEGLQYVRESWEGRGQMIQRYLNYYYISPELIHPVPFLNGTELIEITGGISGPGIGRLLCLLKEAQVMRIIRTKEEARHFVQSVSSQPDIQRIEDFESE